MHERWRTSNEVATSTSNMNKQRTTPTAQACGAQVASKPDEAQPRYRQIKLALDVHVGDLMVGCIVDGAKPQPPQNMTTERFLEWVAKQKTQAQEPNQNTARLCLSALQEYRHIETDFSITGRCARSAEGPTPAGDPNSGRSGRCRGLCSMLLPLSVSVYVRNVTRSNPRGPRRGGYPE